MTKSKKYEIVDGKIFNTVSTALYIQGRKEIKHYYYLFNCSNCGAQYTLKELAERK